MIAAVSDFTLYEDINFEQATAENKQVNFLSDFYLYRPISSRGSTICMSDDTLYPLLNTLKKKEKDFAPVLWR